MSEEIKSSMAPEGSSNERLSGEQIQNEFRQEQKEHMQTILDALEQLKKQGYTNGFQYTERGMSSRDTNEIFGPEDLTIERVYRFEGESNPDDMAVLYKIRAASGTLGYFSDAYGAYGSYDAQELAEFLKKVRRLDEES